MTDEELWDIMTQLNQLRGNDTGEDGERIMVVVGDMTLADIGRAESLCSSPGEDRSRQLDTVFLQRLFRLLTEEMREKN